jgi:hypothetical protein
VLLLQFFAVKAHDAAGIKQIVMLQSKQNRGAPIMPNQSWFDVE